MSPSRAQGRPRPASASRETRLAPRPSVPAKAGMEPRPSFPLGDWAAYSPTEGHVCP